ncbi:endolytic transglycosylase MltG [Miltoncostaea marina]|uniref:endolytic transglycosylase MltG n=1 Tax=Miltoncostaea marina TaxID=2843215 RepID=UPI001C3C2814|nr:endolytic transglycosylase MltG [Miltoncostaea marina]
MSPEREPGDRYRRYGRPRERAGRGRTVLWLALVLVMAVAALAAAGRGLVDGDDPPPPEAVTAPEPAQRLLVREGLRREDVARLLDAETSIPGERYLALTRPGPRGRALARSSRPVSLEGFLFPATYEITGRTTAAELVDQQVAAYRAAEAQVDYSYARARNLTRYDVLILASLIEREVAVPGERRRVAGVLYNRLRQDMRLDIDATVQYALGEWKPELTASDLAVDSPYNTRRYPGLPPGPIASPGLDSIRAAARPERHDYLYYVAKNDGSGGHYFASTAAEHEANIARAAGNGG